MYIVTGWLLFAVVIAVLMYLVHPPSFHNFNFFSELKWELAFALVWIPSTPLVLSISKRFKVSSEKKMNNILFLSLFGAALSVVLCFGHAALFYLMRNDLQEFPADIMLRSFFYNIDKMLIVYCVLVVFQQALSYYEEIKHRELKTSQLQSQLAQAQMQALKMQLQPHFLFNTLNAIVTLIHKNPDQAEEMIVRLSEFLRLTLEGEGEELVPLKRELDFVRAYIEIEQVRFDGKLAYKQSVPQELMDLNVPMLILQPLVENAIKHGISRYQDSSTLGIDAQQEDGMLRLSVSDDGVPSNDAKIEREASKGIGLSNTRMRLQTVYGERAAVNISVNKPRGFCVDLLLPIEDSKSEH